MRMKLILAAGLAAAGLVAGLSTAGAVEKGSLAKAKKMYAAIVAADGTIIDSVDVDSVARTGVGLYTITFNKKIEQCFPVATIFSGSSGAIRIAEVPGEQKQLYVRTRTEGTAAVNPDFGDRAFSILVMCP